jgi:hypothetical protein
MRDQRLSSTIQFLLFYHSHNATCNIVGRGEAARGLRSSVLILQDDNRLRQSFLICALEINNDFKHNY